jgi:hypothetical protein
MVVPLSPLTGDDSSRSRFDQWLGLEDTLLAVSFVKKPLHFCELDPAVLGVIQELCFFVLKTYFVSVIQKYIL